MACIRSIPPDLWRGELGCLAVVSPTVHRLVLELIDHQALALAGAIADTTDVPPQIATLQGIALAGVFQIIIAEACRGTLAGHDQAKIADELAAAIENIMDKLDRWLSHTPLRRNGGDGLW